MSNQQVSGEPVFVDALIGVVNATAVCPAGTTLLSGGYTTSGEPLPGLIQIIESKRDDLNPSQWNVSGIGLTGLLTGTITAYAVCTI
ncbi:MULTISPECIES: hypothetical protein [unclassified Streptomyces]|uniref:hypothetical protein n=1 Tax=unclassified Streptomyces TaxID=2593676 RepID=UPI001F5B33AD|nr:hypothetical protein [Streptomyces sp. HSG2]